MNYSNKTVILFDGVCNLCNKSVQYVLKRDKKKQFHFASLQSDAGQEILLHYYNKKFIKNLDSIVLVDNNKAHHKSTAILYIGKKMRFPYNIGMLFLIIPTFIRDYIYDFIAKNRYKWFGKMDSCMIPSAEVKSRFLL